MSNHVYDKKRDIDPTKLEVLVELREQHRLSQDVVGAFFGLEGRKRHESVGAWESGRSRPAPSRRGRFITYLLDKLYLFREPKRFVRIWSDVMVEQWGWRPIDAEEIKDSFPGNYHLILTELVGSDPPLPQVSYPSAEPPIPINPPASHSFVGRQDELSYFSAKLTSNHFAAIVGMPGVGKTSLAWKLTEESRARNKLFWHAFRLSEDITEILWDLAGFLYHNGQGGAWHRLQQVGQAQSMPAKGELIRLLLSSLPNQGYVLWLDDLHNVEADPLIVEFGRHLHRSAQQRDITLIVTSRTHPAFLQTIDYEPLQGLRIQDTRRLLAERGILRPEGTLLDRLHQLTEGNVLFLVLAIEALRQGWSSLQLLDSLEPGSQLQHKLSTEVDRGLSDLEREVMIAVALMEPTAPRRAVEAVLGSRRAHSVLSDLTYRHLLRFVGRQSGAEEYTQHVLIRSYFSSLPTTTERRDMNHQLGVYFESEPKDTLRAATHFLESGNYEHAAHLASTIVWDAVNHGRATALRELLMKIPLDQLSEITRVRTYLARGEVNRFLHAKTTAVDDYHSALTSLEVISDSTDARELRARACLGLAGLLQHESNREAQQWLEKGLDELGEDDNATRTELLIRLGTMHMAMGHPGQALLAIQEALARLSTAPSILRVRALITLGAIHSSQGDALRGHPYTMEALHMCKQLNDHFWMLSALGNSGLENQELGNWQQAASDYRRGLAIARDIQSEGELAKLENNLGLVLTLMGDLTKAVHHLSNARQIATKLDLKHYLAHICSSLADVYVRKEEWQTASVLLEEAEQHANDALTTFPLPEICFLRAQVGRAQHQIAEAIEWANRSIKYAGELNLHIEEGKAWRALGQALVADRQLEPARAAFEQSVTLLESRDSYEAARTQMQYGLAIMSFQGFDQAKERIMQARDIFSELGARLDMEAANRALAAH